DEMTQHARFVHGGFTDGCDAVDQHVFIHAVNQAQWQVCLHVFLRNHAIVAVVSKKVDPAFKVERIQASAVVVVKVAQVGTQGGYRGIGFHNSIHVQTPE